MHTALLDVAAGRVWFRIQRAGHPIAAWVSCSLLKSLTVPSDAAPLDTFRDNEAFVRTIANSLYDGTEPIAMDDQPWIRAWTRLIVSHYA